MSGGQGNRLMADGERKGDASAKPCRSCRHVVGEPHDLAVTIGPYPILLGLPILVAVNGAKTPTAGKKGIGHALSVLRKY